MDHNPGSRLRLSLSKLRDLTLSILNLLNPSSNNTRSACCNFTELRATHTKVKNHTKVKSMLKVHKAKDGAVE